MLILIALLMGVAHAQMDVCEDATWQCITWKKYCNDPMNKAYMEINCRETCGLCPKCEDKSFRCPMWKSYCFDKANVHFMKDNCPLTCGHCSGKTTTAAPPPTPTWKVIPAGKCGQSTVPQSRVIAGVDAKQGAWPWQVLIRFMGDPHCGGSIIDPYWIVTAAHCVAGKEALKKSFKVIVGEHNFDTTEGSEVELGVSEMIVHSNYSLFTTLDSDIALIKVNRPIPFNKKSVAAVCLPDKDDVIPVGTKCYITGWGKVTAYGGMHPKLQQAPLPVVKNSKCGALNTESTKIPVTSNMLCAGHGPLNPQSGCHGDSGGPFVCQTGNSWVLHGAVSWGSGSCDTFEAYTVFARISIFREWIDQTRANN